MSNSVVPAAAVAHAKQLVRNKKLIKRTEDQKAAQDEHQAADKDPDATHVVNVDAKDHQVSMSDTTLSSDFSFAGALSAAAASSASLTVEVAQDDSGAMSDDDGGAGGTILLVGAVGLVGLGIAVLAGGGGGKSNEAPTITSGATGSVAENAPIATVVYQAAATDPDGDPLSYSLTGTDAAAFNISSTGAVTLKASADFETKSSYSINVVVSDGELTATKAVAISITDVAEVPVFTSGATGTVAENSPTTTVVYDAAVAGSLATTYALSGADAAAFTIDSATGEVRFVASPNFEAKSAYDIAVVATNATGSTTKDVDITVTNVNEAPTAAASQTVATSEETAVVVTVAATDPDAGDTLTYSVKDADQPDSGTISVGSGGQITYTPDADFTGTDSFVVTITDSGNLTTTQTVTVTVGPQIEEFSLDIVGETSTEPAAVDASTEMFRFTDDAGEDTDVAISGFSEDDVIAVTGAEADDYNFGTGTDADDLFITFVDNTTGASNLILIEDVLAGSSTFISDYESAVEAVGFNFMTFA